MKRGFSKRHLKRLAAAEVSKIKSFKYNIAAESISKIEICAANIGSDSSQSSVISPLSPQPSSLLPPSSSTSSSPTSSFAPTCEINNLLKQWYLEYFPTRASFEALLIVLKKINLDVPLSLKAILGEKEETVVKTVPPGEYLHIGIENQLVKILKQTTIGIDGLPLYKSSRQNLWPILGHITNLPNSSNFLIGSYLGKGKPECVDSYLEDFKSELKELGEKGFHFKNKIIIVKVRAFICDAPARAFICGIMGHNSLHGCSKCKQLGKQIEHVVTFNIESSELRSDDDFFERIDKNHHQKSFKENRTSLEKIGMKMVSQFPLDPMHLLDLGVTKKILSYILNKQTKFCVSNIDKKNMSLRLLSLSSFMPLEFARKPRSFDEIKLWKATEFRQFILYLGIVVFKNILHDDIYYHFLLFHCAYRLLSSKKSYRENVKLADGLLKSFVKYFPLMYPENSVTYNVHNMLHITQCVQEFGYIHDLTAYKFENFLQQLKRKVRKPTRILQQLNKHFCHPHFNAKQQKLGFQRNKCGKILCYKTDLFTLTTKQPNNICCIKPCTPIKIESFIEIDSEFYIVGKKFANVRDFL